MGDIRSAIFSTYRGYCSELFVYGSCSKLQSGCKFDHSAATLELCIKSFTLLSKRDLLQHGSLPPPPLRPTPPAGHNNPYNSNCTYTPTVKPNGPLTHPARSTGFTVLPRTTGQSYQSRSHAPQVTAGPSLSALEDQPAASSLQLDLIQPFDSGIVVVDPDHAISTILLTSLASATSATILS